MGKSLESSTKLFDSMFEVCTALNQDPRFVAHAAARANSVTINPVNDEGVGDNDISISAKYAVDNGGVGFGGTYRSKYSKIYFARIGGILNTGTADYGLSVEDLTVPFSDKPYAWACSVIEGQGSELHRRLALQQGGAGTNLNVSHHRLLEAKSKESTIPGLPRFALMHAGLINQNTDWQEYPTAYNEQRKDFLATEQFIRHVGLNNFNITSWVPVDFEGAYSLVISQTHTYGDIYEEPHRELRVSFDEDDNPEYTQIERATGEKIATINSLDTEKLLHSLQVTAKLLKANPTSYIFAENSNVLLSHRRSVANLNKSYLNALPVLG